MTGGKSMLRIHAKRLAVLGWACLCAWRMGFGQTAPSAQTAPARPAHVDLVAVNQHTFRLSISFVDKPRTPASMFVTSESAKKADVSKVVNKGSWSGIKNGAGQLLMDRTAGSWMLKDSQGRVVIPATAWPTLGSDTRTGKAQVICPIGEGKEQVIYGSGDMNGGIVQTRRQGRRIMGTFHGIQRCFRSRESRLRPCTRKACRSCAFASRAWATAIYWSNRAGGAGFELRTHKGVAPLPDGGLSSAF
jgi:hypothetical protein